MLPEEQELNRLENEQATLEDQVANNELILETLKAETAQFQHHYYQTVGRLYVELDEIIAQIARVKAGLEPDNTEAQTQAETAEQQARKSAEEAGITEQPAGLEPDNAEAQTQAETAEQQARKSAEEAGITEQPTPPREITPELKQTFRQAAKLMHPDRATTDTERDRRNIFMAKVNLAYAGGNQAAIEKLIVEFGQDPEAITGGDTASRLVKTIRRIAQLRRRLTEVEKEIAEYKQSELYQLMTTVNETKALGGDPLADLAQQLMQHISEHKIELEILRQQREPRI